MNQTEADFYESLPGGFEGADFADMPTSLLERYMTFYDSGEADPGDDLTLRMAYIREVLRGRVAAPDE